MSTPSSEPDKHLISLSDALEERYRRDGMNVDLYQDKAVAKVTLTSAAVASGAWVVTEGVFGFWGLIVAIPATWAVHLWLAHRARRI